MTIPSSHYYNIHTIITVTSDVRLPELEQFMVGMPIDRPTIRVRISKIDPAHAGGSPTEANAPRLVYDDHLGALGFGIEVTMGETIEVTASAMLRFSPHVLYTNIVEPILRWTFVRKGYALVHGACLAFGREAYLVTARTDTGKTTTILRVLDHQRRADDDGAFLSDDLTLVSADGHVLTYPKPLTISSHTVAAINTPLLSWKERLTLPFQSRLHSRRGRRFALFLSQKQLPIATINTIVQLLVPPPKYHVQRLVPRAKLSREAQLVGMFVIERGVDGEVRLNDEQGLDILMRNCDDAYGFPPYHQIANFLHANSERDLRTVERGIVAQALHGLPMVLLRSSTMDWAQRVRQLARALHLHEQQAPVRGVAGDTIAISLGRV